MDIRNCKKLLIFGGSFDPPHNAHITLPLAVCRKVQADGVIYIPAGNAPHKQDIEQTAAHHRLKMLQLALKGQTDIHILTSEIEIVDSGEPTYTIDTLVHLRKLVGDATQLHLLIGADMLRIFDTWRDAKKIIEIAPPLVMVRPPDTRNSLLANLPDDYEAAQWEARLIDVPLMNISSSMIRNRISENLDISQFVPQQVVQYIQNNQLYR